MAGQIQNTADFWIGYCRATWWENNLLLLTFPQDTAYLDYQQALAENSEDGTCWNLFSLHFIDKSSPLPPTYPHDWQWFSIGFGSLYRKYSPDPKSQHFPSETWGFLVPTVYSLQIHYQLEKHLKNPWSRQRTNGMEYSKVQWILVFRIHMLMVKTHNSRGSVFYRLL